MAQLIINGEVFTDEDQHILDQAMNPARSMGAQMFQDYSTTSLCRLRAMSMSHQAFGQAYRQQAKYVAKDFVRSDPQQGMSMFRAGQVADRFEKATGVQVQMVPQGGQVGGAQPQQQAPTFMSILEKFSTRLDGIETKLATL